MQNNLGRLGGQLGVALCVVGFLVILLGWNGAASYNSVASQFPYLISGAAVGLAVVVVGAAMIVVQNQRTDRARVEAVLERLVAAVERQGAPGGGAGGAAALAGGVGGYVIAGTTSYHQLDCRLHEARDEAHVVPLVEIRTSGLSPCRVCRPPQFGLRVNDSAETVPPLATH